MFANFAKAATVGILTLTLMIPAIAQSVGDDAPDCDFDGWINGTGEKSMKDFRGRCVLLELWSTG